MNGKFCRDCYNFEARRDIDETVLCAKIHKPGVCCEEFEIRDPNLNRDKLNLQFCSECCHFEDRREIDGTVYCVKNHEPGISCDDFIDRFRRLQKRRNQNHIRTAIIDYHNNNSSPTHTLIQTARSLLEHKFIER